MPVCFRVALIAALFLSLPGQRLLAVDVVGQPPGYSTEKFRAEWHQKPLAKVLDDLSGWIEKPVTRSAEVSALGARTVTLADEHKVPLRETLEVLERTQQLHITIEPLRLRIETAENFRDRTRRQVDLNLRDYGTFFVPLDTAAKNLAVAIPTDFAGISLLAGGDEKGRTPGAGKNQAATSLLERLRSQGHDGGMELRGNGNIFMLLTPDEETATRASLVELYRVMVRRTDWRVTFGTLPTTEAPAGGLMSRSDAEALVLRLKNPRSLSLTSMNGQRVNAATRTDRAYLADLEVVSEHLDPTVKVLSLGQSADLRALAGFNCTWVGFSLAWADPLADPPTSEVSAVGGPRRPVDSTMTLKKDEAGPVTATVTPTPASAGLHGESVAITKPTWWTWQPQGECYLPSQSALVLVSEHPAGRAVIVLSETTP